MFVFLWALSLTLWFKAGDFKNALAFYLFLYLFIFISVSFFDLLWKIMNGLFCPPGRSSVSITMTWGILIIIFVLGL